MPGRTDLACEAAQLYRKSVGELTELNGVISARETVRGFAVEEVEITTEDGAERLGKPIGRYVTVEMPRLPRRGDEAFAAGAATVAEFVGKLLHLRDGDSVLVAGLGNDGITADAVGPLTVKSTLVTRHLKARGALFPGLRRSVSAVEAGVSGNTGVESAELISAVVEKTRPDRVVAVDALASLSVGRICRTVQLSDTGIVPGSGVGNARKELSRRTLGVPVLAVGVPTVVDAVALAEELSGTTVDEKKLKILGDGMIVTPREIDRQVRDISRLIGYGLDLAFHPTLTVEEITMLLE